MSRLDAMMNQYKTNSTSSKTKKSNKFDENNYFATFLKDGINSAQRKIRIVEPNGQDESPFVEIMGHKKQVEGKWRTFICAKHEKGEKCPFCEARELLLAQGDEVSRKEAIQYSGKKMYVVKVIDREHPEHGVKFWRFNHHYKNAGTWDKIHAALGTLPKTEDPFSAENGRDMIVTITRDGKISTVTGINFDMVQTPLGEDAEQAAAWKADDKTWEDVYSVKPYEYNEIIVRGGIPAWEKFDTPDADGKNGKWIDKVSADAAPAKPEEAHDSELAMGVNNAEVATENVVPAPESAAPESVAPESVAPEVAAPVAEPAPAAVETPAEDEDDDLPF